MKRNSFDMGSVAAVGFRTVLGAGAVALLLSAVGCGTTAGGSRAAAVERTVIFDIGPHDGAQVKANVVIDGVSMGMAPMGADQCFSCRVLAGKRITHKLKITAEGFNPYEDDLVVPAASGAFWVKIELKRPVVSTAKRPEDK